MAISRLINSHNVLLWAPLVFISYDVAWTHGHPGAGLIGSSPSLYHTGAGGAQGAGNSAQPHLGAHATQTPAPFPRAFWPWKPRGPGSALDCGKRRGRMGPGDPLVQDRQRRDHRSDSSWGHWSPNSAQMPPPTEDLLSLLATRGPDRPSCPPAFIYLNPAESLI